MIIRRRYLLSQGLSQAHELPFAQASKGIFKCFIGNRGAIFSPITNKIQTESRSLQK